MKQVTGIRMLALLCIMLLWLTTVVTPASGETDKDIRKLSQHFIEPGNDIAPWIFVPEDNIESISTDERRGYLTLWEAGKGKDIKGILNDPIRIDDYPVPWEFHLGIVQNQQAMKGISENQINYAIGLNIAVTFSDPSTWPEDRTQTPPDTHSLQLFVVHLGNQGENYRQGIPLVRRTALNFYDSAPEVYLIYGRGDLAENVIGNWNMPYTWVGGDPVDSGTWSKENGPADYNVRFRVAVRGPQSLTIGVGYGKHSGWKQRNVNLSHFGSITGIWEIGPIISLDRWIQDELADELGLKDPPAWLSGFEKRGELLKQPSRASDAAETHAIPGGLEAARLRDVLKVEPPDPAFEYHIDYAMFHDPLNPEHYNDDFDIPGFFADQKWYNEGPAITEMVSHPGYLTVTLLGMNGGWAMCPILVEGMLDLSKVKPPFEVETAFIAPDDVNAWNFEMQIPMTTVDGKSGGFSPGLQFIPGEGRQFMTSWDWDPTKVAFSPTFNVEFEDEIPQSILTHDPLHMLVQLIDQTHLRVGFKGYKDDPWFLSKVFDTTETFGTIGKILWPPIIGSFQGTKGRKGWGPGNYPNYQQFLFDYIHVRRELTVR